jgi:lipopolysaccharide transport system ATP-binding protein
MPFEPQAAGFGELRARITDVCLRDAQGRELAWVVGGEQVVLDVTAIAEDQVERPIIGFYLKDRLGQQLFGDNTYLSTRTSNCRMAVGQAFRARFEFTMPRLRAGDYFFRSTLFSTGSTKRWRSAQKPWSGQLV